MNDADVALICKALGDTHRLKIVNMLENGELCVCVFLDAFEIRQPTLSHHMKILRDCGLVNMRKIGKVCHYSLDCDTFRSFQDYIARLACCKLEGAYATTTTYPTTAPSATVNTFKKDGS